MNVLSLPAGYRRVGGVDLVRDRRAMLAVNLAALLLMALLFVLGIFLVPLSLRFRFGIGALAEGVLLLGAVALYMVLHELVHGVLMRRYSGARPRYGFNGLYAYAGSDAYFDKRSYRIIALAPVVLWGARAAFAQPFASAQLVLAGLSHPDPQPVRRRGRPVRLFPAAPPSRRSSDTGHRRGHEFFCRGILKAHDVGNICGCTFKRNFSPPIHKKRRLI